MYAEKEDYLKLKLNMHINEDKGSKESSFRICFLLRSKRSFLPLEDYLVGSSSQKKFKEWFQQYKKLKNEEIVI